ATSGGHTGYPEKRLTQDVMQLTGQSEETVAAGLENALRQNLLRRGEFLIYTPGLFMAERELARLVVNLSGTERFAGEKLLRFAPLPGSTLSETQLQAVANVAKHPLSIITGGPGVGKTTVVGEIVRRARKANLKIALAAPTGRAAKRLSESTGITAKTIHRLLVYDPESGHFVHGKHEPLEADLVIIDEVSMLDVMLALSLFRSIRGGTSVVLVGDADQLPSVGPGTVLADFIASGRFQVTELATIFRQSQGSRIVENAHRINRGALPAVEGQEKNETDFYWINREEPAEACAIVTRLVSERIPEKFHFDPVNDVQILTPMNRGECGAFALNHLLQKLLNKNQAEPIVIGERHLRIGDKVMQVVNNYDKNVFNGDIGRILSIDYHERKFLVSMDADRIVEYSYDEADQLHLAYAVTVHKSQGCEFPVVILPLLTQHYVMLQRNLLYTAVTRAKKLMILVGSVKAVKLAVANNRSFERYGMLEKLLKADHDEDAML
ncbi:MAG: AAA family ATPase, partial [Victivallaceae bacterium]|nr:AAA family ATPase [Victivallaceae bacterium]